MAGLPGGRGLAVLMAAVLASCSAVTSTPSVDALTLLLSDSWATAPAVADAITEFEDLRDVRVEVRAVQFGQIEEFLMADRAGAREIDAAQWHAFAAGALDHAQPVTDRFRDRYPEGTFVPGAVEDVSWEGEVYGVPLDVNAVVMIVNTVLEDLGFGPEDLGTWRQVREVARAASAQGVRLTHLAASTWAMYAWVRANGGRWLEMSGDGPARTAFDAGAVVEAFDWLAGLVADDLAYAAADVDTSSDALPLFEDEQTVVLTSGSWDVARLEREDPGFDWTVVPMPVGPSADETATVLGGSSLFVAEQATDGDLAWELITDLVEPEHAMRYAREEGRLPGRVDLLDDPYFETDAVRVAVEELPRASAMRLIAFPRVFDPATRTIYEVLHGHVPADEAFRGLQERARRLTTSGEAGAS